MHALLTLTLALLSVAFPSPANSRSSLAAQLSTQRPANLANFYATQSGRVPIRKDSSGFYVAVDLTDDVVDASDTDFGSDTVEMMLGLYTNDTLLVDNCLDFKKYDCKKYSCTPIKQQPVLHEFPDFTAKGTYATANAFLDYNYWNLNSWAVLVDSCTSETHFPYASARSGLVGMGVKGASQANYLTFPVFSIYINKDVSGGFLLFEADLTDDAASNTPVITLDTNANWQASVNGSIQVGTDSFDIALKMILDLNSDTIGFPLQTFNMIKASLEDTASIKCKDVAYYPTCAYSGSISDLPTISIQIGDDTLDIPPDIYAQESSDTDRIVLNMRGLSETMRNVSYVTAAYNETIILGYYFMSYYYSVFNASLDSTYTITLYKASLTPKSSSWILTMIAILGVISFLLVCVCCYFSCKKRMRHKVRTTGFQASHVSHGTTRRRAATVQTRTSSIHEEGSDLYTTFIQRQEQVGNESVAGTSENQVVNGSTV